MDLSEPDAIPLFTDNERSNLLTLPHKEVAEKLFENVSAVPALKKY